ncbi:MAG: hypothetical protein AAFR68_18450 [Pseudomonadota bacterium]
MSEETDINFSQIIDAVGNIDRIEFDLSIRIAEGITCKGTVFVRRNIEDGEG